MESLKSQLISNLARLQEEANYMKSNLKKLLQQNKSVVKNIEGFTLKELPNNKTHCLNVTSDQHSTIEKLLIINMDLEEFVSTCQFADKEEIKQTKSANQPETVTDSSNNEKDLSDFGNHAGSADFTDTGELKAAVTNKLKQLNLLSRFPKTLPSNNETDLSDFGNQASSSDFTDTGKLKAAVTNKLKQLNLLSRFPKTLPNDQTSPTLSKLLKEIEAIETAKEIVDSFSESSNDGKDSSGSGRTADGSDFSEAGEVKAEVIEKLKRLNLLSRKERNKQNVRKVSISELTLPDDETDTPRRRKERKRKHSEDVTEAPISTKFTVSLVDETVIPAPVDTESHEKPVEEEKHLKVLADSPEPFVGMRCIVSHIISPSEFYINSWDENIPLLENISQEVAEIYGQSYTPYKTKQEAKENLGNYCLCYLEKWNYWYRAEVINWHMKAWGYRENVVTVFILDFGYVTTTSYVNLRELLDQHCSIQKYAIKCRLMVSPLGLISSPDEWPVTAIDVMKEFVGVENENIFQIVDVDRERDSYTVDLVREVAEENTTLAEYLTGKGVATRTISTTNSADGKGALKYVGDESSPTNTISSDTEVINAMSGNVETMQCLFFQRNGYCLKQFCRYDHNLTETRNY